MTNEKEDKFYWFFKNSKRWSDEFTGTVNLTPGKKKKEEDEKVK